MDASALLTKQGWRGAGHGLGSSGHGIPKPLLVSNKQDALGVGKKKIQVADQWWMRAYDAGLKELGTGKQTALSSIRQNGINKGGLYGFFVRGEGLAGTISDSSTATEASSSNTSADSNNSTPLTTPDVESTPEPAQSEKKRKRDGEKDDKRKRRKDGAKEMKSKKSKRSSKEESSNEEKSNTTEDAKLLRRAAKKAIRQQRAQRESEDKQSKKKAEKMTESRIPEDSDSMATGKPSKSKKDKKKMGQSTSEKKSAQEEMSEKKLRKYAAKAAEKGITVEAYVARKESRKAKTEK